MMRQMIWLSVVSIATLGTCVASGQDTLPKAGSIRVYNNPVAIDASASFQEIQMVTGDGVYSTVRLATPGGFYMPADPGHLISNSQVRKDLELDADQIKELTQIQKEFQQEIQNRMKSMQSGKTFDHKKWNETIQQLSKDKKAAMGAVLLPHQSKRLQQISNQMKMKNRGDVNALVGDSMAKELGIDERQAKELKKRADEIRAEMEDKIAEIKEQARNKLIRELRPDQREKLEDMLGDKFEVKKPKRRR